MTKLRKIGRLFVIKTRLEAYLVTYAIAVGAVERGRPLLQNYPGNGGILLAAACLGVPFIAGAKLLDSVRPGRANPAQAVIPVRRQASRAGSVVVDPEIAARPAVQRYRRHIAQIDAGEGRRLLPPRGWRWMSNAQSGLAKATATRAPLDGVPPSGCQAEVPTRRICSELMVAPVSLTSVKLPASASAGAGNASDRQAKQRSDQTFHVLQYNPGSRVQMGSKGWRAPTPLVGRAPEPRG